MFSNHTTSIFTLSLQHQTQKCIHFIHSYYQSIYIHYYYCLQLMATCLWNIIDDSTNNKQQQHNNNNNNISSIYYVHIVLRWHTYLHTYIHTYIIVYKKKIENSIISYRFNKRIIFLFLVGFWVKGLWLIIKLFLVIVMIVVLSLHMYILYCIVYVFSLLYLCSCMKSFFFLVTHLKSL